MSHFATKSHPLSRCRPSLDGWWIARAASLAGVRLPADVLPGLAMLLFNRTLYLGSDIATVDVNGGLSPATIDLLITRGPNLWRFIQGIFEHHGSALRLCLDVSGGGRPATFEAPVGSRLLVVTYERAPFQTIEPITADHVGCCELHLVTPPEPSGR